MISQIIAEDEHYTYEILQEKHFTECSVLLANTFTKQNPMELFMKTSYENFYEFALSMSKVVVDDNLSIVSIDKQTKEIHGIVQAGDAKRLDGLHPTEESDKPLPPDSEVMNILQQRFLEDYTKKYGQLKENCLVQICCAGVREDCHGKGQYSLQLS